MIGVRDEYAPRFGRQRLTIWSGGFLSDFEGWATELPGHDGFMVDLDWNRGRVRVECPAPRTGENFEAVDTALADAVDVLRLTEAERHFYEHAGWSYDPKTETSERGRINCARALARAEAHGAEHGWEVRWESDFDAIWDDDVERETTDYDQYMAGLYDDDGNYLAGLGSVDFGPTTAPEQQPYARVVAAQLMIEEM